MYKKIVTVESRKFDGKIHRTWKAKLLNSEANLIILDGVFELEISHPSLGLIDIGTRSIEYYWLDRWYSVFSFYQPDGTFRNYYCNINLPPEFDGEILTFIDLDLDILVSPDMSFIVLDEEEFELNSKKYNYTDELKLNVGRAKDELISLLEKREFPFNNQTINYVATNF